MAKQITDKSFKFYHKDHKSCVYTWHPNGGIISWGNKEDESDDSYEPSLVRRYIKKGTWVVVEEM